ncbi:cadmium resistance transporter [Actinoplanes sp. NPDC051494]|uniref:cadmium resistance transporter n=1 Tax=Actinoplanes sp. NPDC051494 TaxID=3363907 RepID=UPI0037A3F637
MGLSLLGQAVAMFVVTNIDDLLILAVFFGRACGEPAAAWRVVAGQYLGLTAILAVSVAGALGAGLLPGSVIPFLGLVPLALGLKAGWDAWRDRGGDDEDATPATAGVLRVAAVTFANGGDNIGVYVPVFAVAGLGGMTVYSAVFLAGTAVWCAAGWFLATRPVIARALSRWGHIALPVVLIAVGLLILAEAL